MKAHTEIETDTCWAAMVQRNGCFQMSVVVKENSPEIEELYTRLGNIFFEYLRDKIIKTA